MSSCRRWTRGGSGDKCLVSVARREEFRVYCYTDRARSNSIELERSKTGGHYIYITIARRPRDIP